MNEKVYIQWICKRVVYVFMGWNQVGAAAAEGWYMYGGRVYSKEEARGGDSFFRKVGDGCFPRFFSPTQLPNSLSLWSIPYYMHNSKDGWMASSVKNKHLSFFCLIYFWRNLSDSTFVPLFDFMGSRDLLSSRTDWEVIQSDRSDKYPIQKFKIFNLSNLKFLIQI